MPDHTNSSSPFTFPFPFPYPCYMGYQGHMLQPYPHPLLSETQQDGQNDKDEGSAESQEEQGIEYRDGMAFMSTVEEEPEQDAQVADAYGMGMMPFASHLPSDAFPNMPAYAYAYGYQPNQPIPMPVTQPERQQPSGLFDITPLSFEFHPYSEMRTDRLALPNGTVAVAVAMLRVRNLMTWKVPVDMLGNLVKAETPNGKPLPLAVKLIPTDPTFIQVFAKPGTKGKAIDHSLIPGRDHMVACVTAISGSNSEMGSIRFRISCTDKGVTTVSVDLKKMREMTGKKIPTKPVDDAQKKADGKKDGQGEASKDLGKDTAPTKSGAEKKDDITQLVASKGPSEHERAASTADRDKASQNADTSVPQSAAASGKATEPAHKADAARQPTQSPASQEKDATKAGSETGPIYRATVIPQYNRSFVPPTRPIQPPLPGAKIPQGTPWTDAVAAAFDAVKRDTIPNIKGDVTFIEETPKILQGLGFPNLPWVHDRAHLAREAMAKMSREDPDGHGVYRELLDGLSAWLLAPVAVFEPITHIGCVDILLDAVDQFGAPFLACCGLDVIYVNHQPRAQAIRIISIHSRDGIVKMLEEATEQGRMIAVSKKRLKSLTERWDVRGGKPSKTLRPKSAHGGQIPETWQMALEHQLAEERKNAAAKASRVAANAGKGKKKGKGGNQAANVRGTIDDGTKVRAFLKADRIAKVNDKARREAERQAKNGGTPASVRPGRATRNASQGGNRQNGSNKGGSGNNASQANRNRKHKGKKNSGNGASNGISGKGGSKPGMRQPQTSGGKGGNAGGKPFVDGSDGWKSPLMVAMDESDQRARKRLKQEQKKQRRAERKAEKRARQQEEAAAAKAKAAWQQGMTTAPSDATKPQAAAMDVKAKDADKTEGAKKPANAQDVVAAVTAAIGNGAMAKMADGASASAKSSKPSGTKAQQTVMLSRKQAQADGQRFAPGHGKTSKQGGNKPAKKVIVQNADVFMDDSGKTVRVPVKVDADTGTRKHTNAADKPSGGHTPKVDAKTEQGKPGPVTKAPGLNKARGQASPQAKAGGDVPSRHKTDVQAAQAKAKADMAAKPSQKLNPQAPPKPNAEGNAPKADGSKAGKPADAVGTMRPVRKRKAVRRRPGDKGKGVPERPTPDGDSK